MVTASGFEPEPNANVSGNNPAGALPSPSDLNSVTLSGAVSRLHASPLRPTTIGNSSPTAVHLDLRSLRSKSCALPWVAVQSGVVTTIACNDSANETLGGCGVGDFT